MNAVSYTHHIRGKESDEQTRDSEYRTGGDDRRECLVQRFYHCVLGGHALLEVGVSAGNNDRVVDVGTPVCYTHLDVYKRQGQNILIALR